MKSMSIYRLGDLLAPHSPPCISLYQPTHRHHPDNQQDPIRFRNLVAEAEASLRQKYANRELRPLLEPFRALEGDHEFWNHALDGLAVFGSPDAFRVYLLQRPVPELAVVADSLHVKPLVRIVQSADRYQVLCLGRDSVKLYEGNRDALDPIDLADGIPRTNAEALGEDPDNKPERTVAAHGGSARGDATARHGHGSEKDVANSDAERFFRAVDRGVLEHHSRPSGLPLILVTVTENSEIFRRVSHNPSLMTDGVNFDPWSLSADRLREEVWQVVQPHYLRRLAALVDDFREAHSRWQASGDLSDIGQAAVAGQVGTLLVEADRLVPGTLDLSTGRISFEDLSRPEVDDLLDDLVELVLRKGGEVIVVPADRMPTRTGAAAINRY
jgi:Bacterial archaeo-eukaryotic release factor family 3